MYEAFFQLHGSPFPAPPTVTNYFPAQAIETARQSLIRVIERAEGPGFVVGPAGVGKSLLLRVLAEQFAETFRVVLMSGTRAATRKSLLQSIHFELGLAYRGLDEGELRLSLIDALRPSETCPHGILLLLDEAHVLPLRLLDEVRMITNVVRDGQPRARLVLAGGPLLEERFANPKVESFSQRIAARCYLHSMTRDETHQYVRAQVSWAGGDPDAIFTDDAVRAIYQASDGIPRLINQVCDHALLLAHATGRRQLSAALIQEAWSDLQQLPPPWREPAIQPAADASTVIEFGELDADSLDVSAGEMTLAVEPEPETQDSYVVDEFESFDPPVEVLDPAELSEHVQSSVLVGMPGDAYEVEWFSGELETEQLVEEPLAQDPFDMPFEEEVVVIDRNTASEVEAFRGRPRVSCEEGRQILAELKAAMLPAVSLPLEQDTELPAELAAVTQFLSPAFEFTTLECSMPINCCDAQDSSPEDSARAILDQLEHDLDEEIESVPLPWTRGSLGDDRDVIIVEDDTPSVNVFAEEEVSDGEAPRRMEYRELFAQLRRTSP